MKTCISANPGLRDRLNGWCVAVLRERFTPAVLLVAALQGAYGLATVDLPVFHGSVRTRNLFHDVQLYFEYASRMLAGEVPYRDFIVEYPALALPLFLLPRLVAPTFALYRFAFAVAMLGLNALGLLMVARWVAAREGTERVPGRLLWYSLFFAACCPVATARFDLAVMTIAFAAVAWWSSGLPIAGGSAAALAALLKILPGVVAAPAALREALSRQPGLLRGTAAFLVVFGAGVAAWIGGGGAGVGASLRYQLERGLEIESVPAGLLLLDARLRHAPIGTTEDHWARHLDVPLARPVAALSSSLMAAALALSLLQFWRRGLREDVRYAGAGLLGVLCASKMLSPQYLIWLIPFVAVVEGRAAAWASRTFLAACTLTALIYPVCYTWVASFRPIGIALINARNLLLLVLYGVLLFGPAAGDTTSAGPIKSGTGPSRP